MWPAWNRIRSEGWGGRVLPRLVRQGGVFAGRTMGKPVKGGPAGWTPWRPWLPGVRPHGRETTRQVSQCLCRCLLVCNVKSTTPVPSPPGLSLERRPWLQCYYLSSR